MLALSDGFANRSRPSLAFGTGYRLPIGEGGHVQFSGAFNYRSGGKYAGYTWIALRAAYGLEFSKSKKIH